MIYKEKEIECFQVREQGRESKSASDREHIKNKFTGFNEYLHCDMGVNNPIGFLEYQN